MKALQLHAALLILSGAIHYAAAPAIRFSSYLGGTGSDIPTAITTGVDGSIYVTGIGSSDFPQAQTLEGGGTGAFVAKIAPDGKTLTYVTLIGGFFPRAIAVDGAGQVCVAGHNYYNGFPSKNALQTDIIGGFDAAVVKLNAQGNGVIFATYLGGDADETALSVAIDGTGDIWLSGMTTSANFPTANQPFQAAQAGTVDGFLTRLSADGTVLEYSTYFGGTGFTQIAGMAIDALDRPVVTGRSNADDLPSKNALQPEKGLISDAFVTKFDATGRTLVFSTFLGGSSSDSGSAVALDAAGNIYIEGITRSADFPTRAAAQPAIAGDEDIFLAKLLPDGSALVYSTFLGSPMGDTYRGYPYYFGADDLPIDVGGVAVTPAGRALVVGSTYDSEFPLLNTLKNQAERYYIETIATLYEPDGTIGFSTYIGSNGSDLGLDVAATPDGGFVFTGSTYRGFTQPDFGTTPGVFQPQNASTDIEAFVVKLDTSAPPLPNDDYEDAVEIPGSLATLIAQTGAATKEPNEPNHNGNAGGKSVWYRWTAPTAGRAIITTEGSNFKTVLAIYRSDAGSQYIPIQLDGPPDHETYSEARFPVTQGQVVYIAVDGFNGASGYLMLSVALSLPPNDDFANRQLITGSSATVTGSNVGATGERGDVSRNTVWYKWTPPAAGAYTLSTAGSDFNTGLALYAGSDPTTRRLLTIQNSYVDAFGRTTFRAEAGVEYQFAIFGDDGAVGQLSLSLAPAVRPPNDDFANGAPLTGRNELVTGGNFDAVFDLVEQDFQRIAESPTLTGKLVWWEWTAPIDGAVNISVTSVRDAAPESADTSILVFAGDTFPTQKSAIQSSTVSRTPSIYLTEVHAGTHYQIGLDAVEWQQPVQFTLKIRAIAPPKIIPGSISIDSLGKFKGRAEGIEGTNYRVMSSANLVNWTEVSRHPAITGEFAFESAPGTDYRFFRIEEYSTSP